MATKPFVYTVFHNEFKRLCLQFRGPRITKRCKILKNGTLVELLTWARERHSEDMAQEIIDLAVGLQQDMAA